MPAEKTGPQNVLVITFAEDELPKSDGGTKWYAKARKMRKDPTIALARALAMAPALAAGWGIEETEKSPESARDFIEDQMQPVRLHLMRTAMSGMFDYGWAPYEKVFAVKGGKTVITKFKPLLHDITEIKVDPENGSFDGFENTQVGESDVRIKLQYSLLFSNDPEGTDWYGQALMKNAEASYDAWESVDKASKKYDKKIAGSHWVVHYPLGNSDYNGKEDVPNDEIANDILDSLEASGAIAIPRKIEAITEDLNEQAPDAWKIEILESSSGGAAFTPRQKYLDALKVRAFELPERAVLEGTFGTKAEAEAHADFAITNIELRHQLIVQTINWHIVNQLLRFNYGEQFENSVYIVPRPLSDPQIQFFKEIYKTLITQPDAFIEEVDNLDRNALRSKLGLPENPENDKLLDEIPREGAQI